MFENIKELCRIELLKDVSCPLKRPVDLVKFLFMLYIRFTEMIK